MVRRRDRSGRHATALVPGSIMLISASTLLARNLYRPLRPGCSEAHLAKVARFSSPLLTLLAVVLTLGGSPSIVSLLLVGFSFVTQLAPSLLAALLGWPRANRFGAMAGIAAGSGFVASTVLFGASTRTLLPGAPGWLHDVNVGIIGLALNCAAMVAVSYLTRHRTRPGSLAPAMTPIAPLAS
ncbi:hypothetical protein SNE35_20370 [Paucibacter sp. R3-3]|uniref:Uncharacterized protein n=1 Tax=Roseateles agri TaxID=3098619 RepID=A0ABU5DNK5_9BURK|nr:hypothetical protein [Paucibacter sp. R3-3]MDY0746879.1 hypothetical protein [Paucibacter sp. R3-3]